jgi:acyl carrier protein
MLGAFSMLPKKEFESRMLAFIQEDLFDEEIEVSPEQSLESLGMQSIELMELVFFIEREFDCKLKASSLASEHLESVKTLAEEVYRQLLA